MQLAFSEQRRLVSTVYRNRQPQHCLYSESVLVRVRVWDTLEQTLRSDADWAAQSHQPLVRLGKNDRLCGAATPADKPFHFLSGAYLSHKGTFIGSNLVKRREAGGHRGGPQSKGKKLRAGFDQGTRCEPKGNQILGSSLEPYLEQLGLVRVRVRSKWGLRKWSSQSSKWSTLVVQVTTCLCSCFSLSLGFACNFDFLLFFSRRNFLWKTLTFIPLIGTMVAASHMLLYARSSTQYEWSSLESNGKCLSLVTPLIQFSLASSCILHCEVANWSTGCASIWK